MNGRSGDSLGPDATTGRLEPLTSVRLRTPIARLRRWLPEGRALPDSIWQHRHRLITRFALIQAVGVMLFGLLTGAGTSNSITCLLIIGIPAALALCPIENRRLRSLSATVSLMFASACIVDLAHGATEAHFHFFVMIGVVALYQDWAVFGVSVLIVLLHHTVMGLLDPSAVFASGDERHHPVQWALIHAGFIAAASVTNIIAWRANEQQELSDPLTRLPNRTAFLENLQRLLNDGDQPVSVLFVDLDNFKSINDSGGHSVGDQALLHAARQMQEAVRRDDLIARIGGDEYAVLLAGDCSIAESIGQRIHDNLQAPAMINNREVFVRASIGAADTIAAGSREAGELLRDADLAMYLAKSSGRNQVAIFTAGIDTVVRDRAQLSEDLRLALGRGEFEVHYQPVIVGEELTMSGVEALLRWHHPTRGLVSPSEFVPLAEETGEIRAIGNWVLMTAARQIAEWQRTLPGCAELNLAVNLSPVQLRDPDLLSHLWNALHSSGLSPTRLTLEVTEGMLLADLDLARRQLDAARALGTKVSIDDFGTGYSSLSYLAQLPADEVKIDRSFVEALSPDDNSIALVKGIVDLASALNLEVLAEGVEARSQQDILTDLGCPRSQGFLYSRALAVGDFAAATEAFRAVPTIDATTIDATTIDATAIDTTIDATTDHPTERMPRA